MEPFPKEDGSSNKNETATGEVKLQTPVNHRPTFANNVQITVSNEEVVFQFVFMRPNRGTGSLVGEIVLTPQHAIRFKNALDETIKKHFTKHLPQ